LYQGTLTTTSSVVCPDRILLLPFRDFFARTASRRESPQLFVLRCGRSDCLAYRRDLLAMKDTTAQRFATLEAIKQFDSGGGTATPYSA
jgi:hypothetical protein